VTINVWAFAAFTVPFVAMPGVSTIVVFRNSLAGGVRAGAATAAGVNASSVVYGMLSALGLSMALQRWPDVWVALRVLGIGYLGWLGLRSLWHAAAGAGGAIGAAAASGRGAARPLRPLQVDAREGFVTNMLNPSIATFYLLVVPQFIPRGAPFVASALLLTAIHVTLALTWHLTWAAAGGSLAAALGRARPRRILEAAAGLALLLLAVRLSAFHP